MTSLCENEICPTHLINGQHYECSTAGHFGYDGNEFRVGGTEIRIVGVPRDWNIVVQLFSLGRGPVDVPEFRIPHTPEKGL